MLPVFSVLGTRLIAAADEGGTARRRNSRFATLQADSELRKRQRSGPQLAISKPLERAGRNRRLRTHMATTSMW
jgi:hypothetical protein